MTKPAQLTEEWIEGDTLQIYLEDQLVFDWYDHANQDYPEDLTWRREISEVFYKGVEAGLLLSEKRKYNVPAQT